MARVHFLQRVPQHIATPLLLHGPVPRASALPQLHPGVAEGVCARAFMYSPVAGVRSPWHPQNGRFASAFDPGIPDGPFDSERRRPSATVIIPRTIYDAPLTASPP